jgi:hypothetical protein
VNKKDAALIRAQTILKLILGGQRLDGFVIKSVLEDIAEVLK